MKNLVTFVHPKGAALQTFQLFIPETVADFHIFGVACGGEGGVGSATKPGGGGGAGDFIDVTLKLAANSLVTAVIQDTNIILSFKPFRALSYSTYVILAGKDGTAGTTTAGLGGESGAGGEGGTVVSAETHFGSGFNDTNNFAHSCGGQAGWDVLPTALNPNFAYIRGPTATLQRCKNKWPNNERALALNNGGGGGVSYFGGSASHSPNAKSSFGAGAPGCDAGVLTKAANMGGDAFISVEWEL